MALDGVEWNPEATGVGSLLMVEPGLPRDEFGHPYQPLFWFDGESRALGLVVDADDHVLAYLNNAQGIPFTVLDPPPKVQRVPEAIDRAARRWWADRDGVS
jgi:hypothetical protein